MNDSAPDVDVILFDLDNTLYPRSAGLWPELDARIKLFVSEFLGLPLEEAHTVQKGYWLQYGTTLSGLMHEYGLEPDPYLAFVHNVDIAAHLSPNAELGAVLSALPHRKCVFTNASSGHARNVLSALGILRYFDQLVGLQEVGYVSKPQPLAYERCLQVLGVAGERCLFVEDTPVNLPPARTLGMHTVLVGSGPLDAADFHIDRVEDIGELFGVKIPASISPMI